MISPVGSQAPIGVDGFVVTRRFATCTERVGWRPKGSKWPITRRLGASG